MHDFIDRLTEMTRKELLYIEGFLCMQHERFAEYERDLTVARALGETARAERIQEDLAAFRREIAYLRRKQASAYERLRALVHDERFPTVPYTDGSDDVQTIGNSEKIIPLERAE